MIRNDLYLNLEQCSHLKELGINMSKSTHIWYRHTHGASLDDVINNPIWKIGFNQPLVGCGCTKYEAVETFTVHEIIEILPLILFYNKEVYYLKIDFQLGIMHYSTKDDKKCLAFADEGKNINTPYKLLCLILENKYIDNINDSICINSKILKTNDLKSKIDKTLKQNNKLPYTWDEYIESFIDKQDNNKIEQIECLSKLLKLKEVYTNGWIPDYNTSNEVKFSIVLDDKNEFFVSDEYFQEYTFSFQKKEIAELFLNNFKCYLDNIKSLIINKSSLFKAYGE